MEDNEPSRDGSETPRCAVIGTSVAGLNAATLLAEQGVAVTLVPSGLAGASIADPEPETLAAHGGDLLMGCHGHLLALHKRPGSRPGLPG